MRERLKDILNSFLDANKKRIAYTIKWAAIYNKGTKISGKSINPVLEAQYRATADLCIQYMEKARAIILKNTNYNSLSLAKEFAKILTETFGQEYIAFVEQNDSAYRILVKEKTGDKYYCIDRGSGNPKKAVRNLFDTSKTIYDNAKRIVCLAPNKLAQLITQNSVSPDQKLQKAVTKLFSNHINDKIKKSDSCLEYVL